MTFIRLKSTRPESGHLATASVDSGCACSHLLTEVDRREGQTEGFDSCMGQNSSQGGKMTTPVRVIVVGAGNRGDNYSRYASIHPERVKVVGVADPRKFARTKLQQQHKVVDENIFEDWRSVIEREKFADAVLICTPDRLHKEPAVAFAQKGYHILLEKPMATTAEDCKAIVEACTQSGVILSVGHVLRYDPLIQRIKELIDAGVIGDVMHIQHLEPVKMSTE